MDFSDDFFRFLRNLKKSPEKSKKKKWGLKGINNYPFETGISPIDRSHDCLQIREIPGSNGEFSTHSRPHFFFLLIFRAIFLRFRRNRKKIVRKITSAGFFGRFFSKKNGKMPKIRICYVRTSRTKDKPATAKEITKTND